METRQLLAPRFEAVGLPNSLERATMTPRRYAKLHLLKLSRCSSSHTHGRLSLLLFLNEFESFLRFQVVKNKARDIRLLNIWYPTPPKELFPNGIPSGFYTTFGVSRCANICILYICCKKRNKKIYFFYTRRIASLHVQPPRCLHVYPTGVCKSCPPNLLTYLLFSKKRGSKPKKRETVSRIATHRFSVRLTTSSNCTARIRVSDIESLLLRTSFSLNRFVHSSKSSQYLS